MIIQFRPGVTYSLKIAQALFMACVLTNTAMAGAAREGPAMLTPNQAALAQNTIIKWLECIDCHDHELEKVAQLGITAVPSLIATLQQGPSEAQREMMRRRLITLFARLKPSGEGKPNVENTLLEPAYVEHYLNGYSHRIRIRAAIALGRIGGSESKAALQSALIEHYPPSVKAVFTKVLKTMEPLPASDK
jgi:hypothetical protein